MIEFERITITLKLPFRKRICFGGGQMVDGADTYFCNIVTEDNSYKEEVERVIRLLREARRMGVTNAHFENRNEHIYISFPFSEMSKADDFMKRLPQI